MNAPAIDARRLAFAWRPWPWSAPRPALRDVTLAVGRGTLHLLAGANGAGKSTLLRVLAGVVRASSGELSLLGEPAGARALRGRVAWLAEASDGSWRLTVAALVELAAALYGATGAQRRARRDEALAEARLEALAGRRYATLSKGEKRRAGVAQALATGAELLLLDEPLDGVDPESAELLLAGLAARARRGATILLSTHVLLDGQAGGDALSLLDGGTIVASGPPAELLTDAQGGRLGFAQLLRAARERR